MTIPFMPLFATLSLGATLAIQGRDKTLDSADAMLNLATATQPLVHTAVVPAPVSEVWKAYTTTKGITSWMVAAGTIDLKVGGLMRTSYTAGSDLKGPDVIENKILSFDPERMVSIQCVRTPARFPFEAAIKKVWTNLYFESAGEGQTKVTCRMLGFDGSNDSTQMRLFFMKGNQSELDGLVKHFAKKSSSR